MLYFSETLLWPLQTFLTPIASVWNVFLTSECFFNFCFRRVSNNRTNPQANSHFKAWHRRLQEMMVTLQCAKRKSTIISRGVFKFARMVVFFKMVESSRLKLFQKLIKAYTEAIFKREKRERCVFGSVCRMEKNEEVEGFGLRSRCR